MFYARGKDMTVERDGHTETIRIPEDFVEKLVAKEAMIFYARMPFVIATIPDTSINAGSGLKKQDIVVSLAGKSVQYFDEGKEILTASKGQQIPIVVERKGERIELTIQVSDEGFMEIKNKFYSIADLGNENVYELEVKKYSFFAALPAGMAKANEKINQYVKQFSLIFDFDSGAYKGVGGFGAFAKMFPSEWHWEIFWRNTAFISLILAFMNILPIPALDGGHVVFLLYEMATRRKPSQKVMEYAQVVGFVLLLTLLVLANGNDIYKAVTR
jgi:regulator of sigma E protease